MTQSKLPIHYVPTYVCVTFGRLVAQTLLHFLDVACVLVLLFVCLFLFTCCVVVCAVERLIKDNCQIDGDDLISYSDFVQSIKRRFDEMDSEHYTT